MEHNFETLQYISSLSMPAILVMDRRRYLEDDDWSKNGAEAFNGIGFFKNGGCLEAVCSLSYSSIVFVSHP